MKAHLRYTLRYSNRSFVIRWNLERYEMQIFLLSEKCFNHHSHFGNSILMENLSRVFGFNHFIWCAFRHNQRNKLRTNKKNSLSGKKNAPFMGKAFPFNQKINAFTLHRQRKARHAVGNVTVVNFWKKKVFCFHFTD